MKKFLVIFMFMPLVIFSQSNRQKKAAAKAEKETITNLEGHVHQLSSNTNADDSANLLYNLKYISGELEKEGLEPKGTGAFIQEYLIDEGNQYQASGNEFVVDETPLKFEADFFPLACSSNAEINGYSSMSLNEKGGPWFFDLKHLVEDNQSNTSFNVYDAIIKEASRAAAKGAKALIVFNGSSVQDKIRFNKLQQTSLASIPVLYVTQKAKQQYFPDETEFYDIAIKTSVKHISHKSYNVAAFLNNDAANTIILGTNYNPPAGIQGSNIEGVALLLELSRMIKSTSAQKNNYLFLFFTGDDTDLHGSEYWVKSSGVTGTPNYMLNLNLASANSEKPLSISEYTSSSQWHQLISSVHNGNYPVKMNDNSVSGHHKTFYNKNIPVLYLAKNVSNGDNSVDYKDLHETLKYVLQIVNVTNEAGKLDFTNIGHAKTQTGYSTNSK